ncbi:ATP synthase subunit I [Tissierella sp. MB52-C2]|uniref:ATP synthase subunit I n=1 Tax=Tissierella sp. MB52-C2 TaxID=3070999 RepID=UPI00280A89EE|nr:ATP synthase subunit I [Tissierella sp. MB52-C2]WMM24243.1 ATP synthase subunit I [Tissierella sp. MB52-C2]
MNNDIVFKVTKRVAIISLLIIGISFFLFKEPKPIIYGYIFGAIISILGFKLLNNTINKAVDMTPGKATAYSTVHYMLRYLIYFIVLAVAALADYLNFPAAILGLLSVKFIIIGSAIFDKDFQR